MLYLFKHPSGCLRQAEREERGLVAVGEGAEEEMQPLWPMQQPALKPSALQVHAVAVLPLSRLRWLLPAYALLLLLLAGLAVFHTLDGQTQQAVTACDAAPTTAAVFPSHESWSCLPSSPPFDLLLPSSAPSASPSVADELALAGFNSVRGLDTDLLLPPQRSPYAAVSALHDNVRLRLQHDDALWEALQYNRPFVDPAQQYSSAASGPALDAGDWALRPYPLHPACASLPVAPVPVDAALDSRPAPSFFHYEHSLALAEACSAGARPQLTVAWGDNLCHDSSAWVHSLHQEIQCASRGNRAGRLSFRVYGQAVLHGSLVPAVNRFLVLGYDARGDTIDLAPTLKGRLVGPAMLAARVQRLDLFSLEGQQAVQAVLRDTAAADQAQELSSLRLCPCSTPCQFAWLVEYTVYDAGLYVLELRTTWLKRDQHWAKDVPLHLRPHGWLHTVYRGLTSVQPAAHSASANAESALPPPRCQDGVHDQREGRWLPLPYRLNLTGAAADLNANFSHQGNGSSNGTGFANFSALPPAAVKEYYCDGRVCSGENAEFLADEAGYSTDYQRVWVWRPVSCILHLYSAAELSSCAVSCRYHHVHVRGDSLAREQYQNLVMLLDGSNSVELPKTHATAAQLLRTSDTAHQASFELPFSSDSLTVHFHVQNPPVTERAANSSRVLLWATRAANGLFEEEPSYGQLVSDYTGYLNQQLQDCAQARDGGLCLFFVNPSLQHAYKGPEMGHTIAHALNNPPHFKCRERDLHRGSTSTVMQQLMSSMLQAVHTHAAAAANSSGSSGSAAGPYAAARPPMSVLYADVLTAARWDSSHDGMHYSGGGWDSGSHLASNCRDSSPNKCPTQDRARYARNWQGGVSGMLTMAWVNTMCNRPCYPPAAAGSHSQPPSPSPSPSSPLLAL